MDTFRATRKLTLTIGVRTAWNSNPVSEHKAFSRLIGPFATISHDVNQPLNQVVMADQEHAWPSTQILQWQPRAAVACGGKPKTHFCIGLVIFATNFGCLA